MNPRLAPPVLLLLANCCALLPSGAAASTFFAAVGANQSLGPTAPQIVGPIDIAGGVGSYGSAQSTCELGRFTGLSTVACPVSGLFTPQIEAPTQAQIYLNDMQFVPAPDFGDPRYVSMTLHMRLTGDLAISGAHPYAAKVTVRSESSSTDVIGQLQLSDQGLTGTGPLAGAPAHMVEYPVDLPVVEFVGYGYPQFMTLTFNTWAGGTALGTEVNTATADFSRLGFHFPSDGPVFDLPAGLTVNIPSLGIVDNHWTDPVAGVAPAGRPGALALAAVRNPVRASARFALTLPAAGAARVEVFDVRGRRVATLLDGWQAAGAHDLAWAATGATAGVYFVRAESRGAHASTRLVVMP